MKFGTLSSFVSLGLAGASNAFVSKHQSLSKAASSQKPWRYTFDLKVSRVDTDSDIMKGTSEFEAWFRDLPGAKFSTEISHAAFSLNLRGLSISTKGKQDLQTSGEMEIMTVPKSIVLSSNFDEADWDAKLAQKLWLECNIGPSSSIAPYISLLTRGWTPSDLPSLPPSTAPDSLRHWTDEEKRPLESSDEGQKLLELLDRQNELWKGKYAKVNGMTFEQFRWAMEVVHSRAFSGDFGVGASSIPLIVTAGVPVVVAAAGFQYYNQNPDPSDAIMLGLGLLAAIPAIFNLVKNAPPVAVLLPMIDSFNHLEEANSSIEYSPRSDSFSLKIGRNCVVDEDEGKAQVYVSYGPKKDTELLLNYGFLRGVPLDDDVTTRRKALANAFFSKQ